MAAISNLPPSVRDDLDRCVESLAVEHRRKEALRALLSAGPRATDALRRGLHSDDAQVRLGCCYVLDFFMDEAALPDLVANLDHDDESVRSRALHTLACDRCKKGACRPAEGAVVPIALRLLKADPSRRVRTQAADMLGQVVHRHLDVQRALEAARDTDPHPMVRKVAGWYAPGGPRFERLKPRPERRDRRRLRARPGAGPGVESSAEETP